MKTITILHLIAGLGQGGAEQELLDMSIEFKKSKTIQNSVISFSKETTLLETFEKNAIDVTVLYKNKSVADLYTMVKDIGRYIQKREIDIVHAHMSHAMIVSFLLKIRFPKLKIVFTPHNFNLGSRTRESIIFLLKPFRSVDILFSDNMKQWFNKSIYKVIPNGIRVENFVKTTEKYKIFTFIAIGNIKEAKNYPFLIECANKLREKIKFQLLIVGEGKRRVFLEQQVRNLKLEKYVQIKGSQNNVAELLSRSHCLVMPSLWEGMPLSILEAGASKLPVISTPVGAIPYIIDDSNGYLTKVGNFCETMEYVYRHYNEAMLKSENLQQKVIKNYSIKSIVKKHEELYRELVNA